MKVHLLGKGPVFEVIRAKLSSYVSVVDKPTGGLDTLLVCSGYPYTIRTPTILSYGEGVINIHTSLLPRYRGRHPVDWAMEKMEKEIGITIHYIDDETIDTGDIILQDSVSYHGEGYDKVMEQICLKVPPMLFAAIQQIKHSCAYRRKQNEEIATYYPKRTKPRIY